MAGVVVLLPRNRRYLLRRLTPNLLNFSLGIASNKFDIAAMAECGKCDKWFGSLHAAQQHMQAVGHIWECDFCDDCYWDEDDLDEHQQEEGHYGPKYDCEACDNCYQTFADAKRHMNNKNHWREHWCVSCQRGFENDNNLRAHLNSKIHRGTDITCRFCKRGFATATGVTHHLEAGSCPQARSLNRDTILAEIRRRDPKHVITKKLLTYHDTSSSIIASSASYNYNRSCYECYLCHKGFEQLESLNQHLNSPVHKEKAYHCPGRACGGEFSALAALFNHLESESCGTVRFDAVQRNVGGILSGKKMIGFA
ncbi:hypothetical protein HBI38_045870 [Parastagonospora nodorum]|nr:hypothetical protein HBH46_129890 [Parastagonospora nodorum]KAH4268410.1 hypothetical protein HBI03_058140 [Parastagonospora nodorum]KAH4303045.1 hypothetical protein HBI01_090730 [Parastagonospora nodorum]KAH4371649.1 hypothetical protein HBH94_116500 [Parastagonospora nodorum]KAH4418344.1 hypothetical protein HBH99_059070 [Parastagonospora nodorum]